MPEHAASTDRTDATAPAVRVEGLWKRFGDQVAVAGIDL
ncbi:MAG TPA: ABC transporter ATP-binding protein, partial [Streptomyces sp.]|nr:ABC transporter ATP-binding protein [Streptomyces sp.]